MKETDSVDFCVIGGGIVGLAVARQLTLARPGASVLVVEKEHRLASHQTGHNSGVVHAGLYYKPGSAKALFCRRGVAMLREFCADHQLQYDECGKIVVARTADEAAKLPGMLERATAIGVFGVHLVGPDGIRDLEPFVSGRAALVSPTTAIVDYPAIAQAMANDVVAAGGVVRLGARVTALSEHSDHVLIATKSGNTKAGVVAICAGLQADRLARSLGGGDDPMILPFRGEYFRLREERANLIRGLVYPVPDPRYPFLGVHFTKRVGGGVDIGPNAVLALRREGYRWRDFSTSDIAEMARWPGAWRLARAHWRAGAYEVTGSLSKRLYARRARAYVPGLGISDMVSAPAGVRAQAVARNGNLIDDFVLVREGRVLAVRNAPSPAATASLAIAEHVVRKLLHSAEPVLPS